MELESKLSVVKGVGPAVEKALFSLGLETIGDLLDYLPRRYEDYSVVTSVAYLKPGVVTVMAEVKQVSGRYARRGFHITEALVSDETGSLRVTWFNQPYRAAGLKVGQMYYFSGQYELSYQRMQLMNPSAEMVADFTLNTARIVPVYRENKSISSKQIRKIIGQCLAVADTLPETLPTWLVQSAQLMNRAEAVRAMHYPETSEQLATARRRLGYEEVFELSLASLLNKQEIAAEQSLAIPFDEQLAKEFVGHLPFTLTNDQRKAVWQIYLDMQQPHPMNRLVEGDVGAGKTVVAAMAAIMAMRQGYQVAVMAPTEILASQHAETFYKLLKPLGAADQLLVLIGSMKPAQKKAAHVRIADGSARLLVGTHALIQDAVTVPRLGLIIIDEQHRFGVEQRKALMAKAGLMPHVLSLTATPIPRSLALTLYGELDISVLREKPAGRLPIATELVLHGARDALFKRLATEVAAGRQLYVVCPLITESDTLAVQSVETVFDELRAKYFKHARVGLLHGKLKGADKQTVMQDFAAGTLDVLVATTVIEVGVDVPNATLMVIESAERFGLAQLHQLRGRVGRGSEQSHCYLVLSASVEPNKRLRAVATSNDGFKLAEYDLELRGAGAIYGAMQHGALDLRVAKLTDTELISAARSGAKLFVERGENLVQYTELAGRVSKLRAVTNLN